VLEPLSPLAMFMSPLGPREEDPVFQLDIPLETPAADVKPVVRLSTPLEPAVPGLVVTKTEPLVEANERPLETTTCPPEPEWPAPLTSETCPAAPVEPPAEPTARRILPVSLEEDPVLRSRSPLWPPKPEPV